MAGVRAWWLRRFRGYVAPPRQHGGRGTAWQEHHRSNLGFQCHCGLSLAFAKTDLVVRDRDHTGDIEHGCDFSNSDQCPVLDARYVKICPNCRLGHWKDASPKGSR